MIWFLVLLGGVLAMPVVIELTRNRMDPKARANAPGEFAQLSNGLTHYEWFGPEGQPVIVCVHGLTTPSFVWGGLTKGLVLMGYRVLTYDLYGRGFSDRPRGAQTRAFFMMQLNELLIDQNVQGPITVIGYSMGGAIAAAFTAQNPDRIMQLILLAPAGMLTLGEAGLIRFILKTPILGDWLMWAAYPFQLRRGIKAERGALTAVPDVWNLQENDMRYRGFVPAVLSSLRGILSNALHSEHVDIAKAGVPVLAIWGAQDDVVPLEASDMLEIWAPNAIQDIIDEAGHGLTYTHTTEILDIIATHVPFPAQ